MISKKEKDIIQLEAREILVKFGEALDKANNISLSSKQRSDLTGYREEHEGIKGNDEFRKRIFKNAPKKNDDCIIAEKGNWN